MKPNKNLKAEFQDDDGFNRNGYKQGRPTLKRESAIDQVGGNWLANNNGRHVGRINNDPKKYDPSNKKQNFLQSSMDNHGYLPDDAPLEKYANNQYGQKFEITGQKSP